MDGPGEAPDATLRVMTMDGGSAGLLQVRLLREIERRLPGFLERTDMFAGVSDGAFMTLRMAAGLARGESPSRIFDGAVALSGEVLRALHMTNPGLLRLVSGARAMGLTSKLASVLGSKEVYGDMRLSDLDRAMDVLTLDTLGWRAAMLRNHPPFTAATGDDPTLVSAALASSAFPIYLPIHFGPGNRHHIDGGLVSNNPAMCALGSAMKLLQERGAPQPKAMLRDWLPHVTLLSLGGAERAEMRESIARPVLDVVLGRPSTPTFRKRADIDWGWFEWLVKRPMFLIDLMLQGSVSAVTEQCDDLLGPQHFRYQPDMEQVDLALRATLTPIGLVVRQLDEAADAVIRGGGLDPVIAWLEKTWMPAPPSKVRYAGRGAVAKP